MTPRHVVTSIRSRTKPSIAGSSVTDAIIIVSTAREPATARPDTNFSPTRNMPSSEIITVVPANRTARPAVSSAVAVAVSGSWPPWSASR